MVHSCEQAWCTKYCSNLQILILRSNNLKSLHGQALGYLGGLRHLDLRDNAFTSLPDVVKELESCSALTTLYLQNAVRGGVTSDVTRYTPSVFHRLRGLATCDDVPIPAELKLNSNQLEALKFLSDVMNVLPWLVRCRVR